MKNMKKIILILIVSRDKRKRFFNRMSLVKEDYFIKSVKESIN